MRFHSQARSALSKLAGVAGDYDENGLDIYFLNSKLNITGCKVRFSLCWWCM